MKCVRKRMLLKVLLVSFLTLSLHQRGFSQFGGGGPFDNGPTPDDPGDPPPDDGDPGEDPDLPIDSNILVLVVAVVGYGLKKMWDVKQNLKRKNLLNTTARYEDFTK